MIFASILAGGTGTRLQSSLPKQFLEINNKPLLIYSLETFLKIDGIDKIIVSSPKDYLTKTESIVNKFFNNDKINIIKGGKTRSDTLLNSINYSLKNGADNNSIMVTHDATRIFVSSKLIEDSIKYAKKYGAASPIIPATDVIFQSNEPNKLSKILERKYLFHAQTPQSFNIFKYLEILENLNENEKKMLNEAMILFHLRNEDVYLFDGEFSNFKITHPIDIHIAKSMLDNKFK